MPTTEFMIEILRSWDANSLWEYRKIISCDTVHMVEALRNVHAEHWENEQEYGKSLDKNGVTLVHLASYTGRLEILKRAEAAKFNLYKTDNIKRCALHYAAGQGHEEVVKWLLACSTSDCQHQLQDVYGRTPLHLAVLNTRLEVVKILVARRVDVNIRDQNEKTPLHLASDNVNYLEPREVSDYEKIIITILDSRDFDMIIDTPQEDSIRSSVLNQAVLLNSITATKRLLEYGLDPRYSETQENITQPLHIAAARGFYDMLCFLLEYYKTFPMINTRNWTGFSGDLRHLSRSGNTPLHEAVIYLQWKCAKKLILSGGDLLVKNNSLTVMKLLFKNHKNPLAFLTDILDHEVYVDKWDSRIDVSFKVLAPEDEQRQMAVVSALMKNVQGMEKMNILQHPLIEAFLEVKWNRLRNFLFILAAFQILFLCCLIFHVMIFPSSGSAWTLFACACIQLCYNVLPLFIRLKYYARQVETWLSILSATICVIVVISEEASLCNSSMGSACSWTTQLTGFAMLFSCIQMTFTIGRLTPCGKYALMFITVLKTVLKVFLALISIIVGFALSFKILFQSNDEFANPWKAFVKTIIMMTGEYDYSDLFASTERKNLSVDSLHSNESEGSFLTYISSMVFLAFIFLANIVVMNLMTGLAVSDTHRILIEGHTRRLMKRAELLNHIELVTSHWIFESRLIPGKLRSWLKSKTHSAIHIAMMDPFNYVSGISNRWAPIGISKKVFTRLFTLAVKNRNLYQESQTTSSCDESKDSFTRILQEELKKLRSEMIQEIQVLKRRTLDDETAQPSN